MHSEPSKPSTDEPEIDQEEAIPSDGRDVEVEEMMKSVRNDKLDEPLGPSGKR
jgi:hypothetical protein